MIYIVYSMTIEKCSLLTYISLLCLDFKDCLMSPTTPKIECYVYVSAGGSEDDDSSEKNSSFFC